MRLLEILSFGFILCFDSLLYTFTILPIRFFLALSRLIYNTVSRTRQHLPPSQKADILRPLLILLSICILVPLTDVSKIYHSIRGQDTIKLYVIFNALEVSDVVFSSSEKYIPTYFMVCQIADRLCTSFGQDIIDCLFSRSTLHPLSRAQPLGSHMFRPLFFFLLATAYTGLSCSQGSYVCTDFPSSLPFVSSYLPIDIP